MDSIRAFTAAELGEEVRDGLERIQDDLRACQCDVKWVEHRNLHVTLHFLGDFDAGVVPDIARELETAVAGIEPFEFRVADLGTFPPGRPPRVIWAAVAEGADRLRDLYERMSAGLARVGFGAERRRYHPHVTLGRVRGPRGVRALRDRIRETRVEPGWQQGLDEIVLKKSELTPAGPNYRELRRIRLPGGAQRSSGG